MILKSSNNEDLYCTTAFWYRQKAIPNGYFLCLFKKGHFSILNFIPTRNILRIKLADILILTRTLVWLVLSSLFSKQLILKEVCDWTSKTHMTEYVEWYFMILSVIKLLEACRRLKDMGLHVKINLMTWCPENAIALLCHHSVNAVIEK